MIFNPYYSNRIKCSFLQRKIIINSILYYELNTNILSDKEFDDLSKKLIELSKQTEDYDKTDYYYCFYDFDGSTGFHLYGRLKDQDRIYLTNLSNFILKQVKRGKR